MQIAVFLVEDNEEGVRRKFVEEIEQYQCRDDYAIFEHIDVLLFVEGKSVCRWLRERVRRRGCYNTSYDCDATLPDSEHSHRRIYLRS